MTQHITRRAVLGSGVGAIAFLGGCTSNPPPSGDTEFLLAEGPHPTKREPTSAGKFYALMGIAETLLNVDEHGNPLPVLATRWVGSADRREWRFGLRPKARFHDGHPVTAEVVAAMLNRARGRPGALSLVPIREIVAEGAQVVIRLQAPSTLLLPVLAHDSTIILSPASFDAAGQAARVLGSGPYRIAQATIQEVAVILSEHWDGPQPQIHKARYLSAARPETRALLAESGQASAVFDLDWPSERRLQRGDAVRVLDIPSPRTTVLKVNASHPFLSDVRARQALSLAIDRKAIAKGLFGNIDRAASQLLPPFFADWHDTTLPALRTDPAQARLLLAELGWRPGPDGILLRGGRRFALKLHSLGTRTDQPLITAAIQQQLRKIGVEVTIFMRSAAEMVAAHKDGTLELAMFARNHMAIANPVGVLMQDYAKGGGDWGAMGWEDPAIIAALQKLASGVLLEEAIALRSRIVRTLQDKLPVIPLLFNTRTAAFDRRIENIHLDPLERSYGLATMRWAR